MTAVTENISAVVRQRDAKLDLLRLLAILETVWGHSLLADHPDATSFLWFMLFIPDVGGIFFMASGGLILTRKERVGWKYVWHRINSFLPEFIIFSTLYVFLNKAFGFWPNDPSYTVTMALSYMLVEPTWGPGWFILVLISLYLISPILWSWVQSASKREIEIGIFIWLLATCIPILEPHVYINVPMSAFSTLFNCGGYFLTGYYLARWPLSRRSLRFIVGFFAVTTTIGLGFGYLLGRSAAKWGYLHIITNSLSLNMVMMALLQYGIVLLLPNRWFTGLFARVTIWLSMLSLGIYCVHWLVIKYWAIPNGISWYVGTAVTLAVSIPVAWLMRKIRLILTARRLPDVSR